MKSTPGPWNLIYDKGEADVDVEIISETRRPRSTVLAFLLPTYKAPAYEDLRLMAAAPDLLAICKEIATDSSLDLGTSELRFQLYAAIAKAEAVFAEEVK